ncbi:TetR/AcrR family transcriptional regulator [uncultured Shewanella sp.]|uniref:TetR/AcrR family transcriptional regulator n=1 Tax=uncultured Shewanella sp. TaxID=173975 RepID=UPI0026085CC7|nr:TetR/AcrR family transcriptional regulator [uncultured Shewanella sp.]
MSGRKQFDEASILDCAMRQFWEKGYTATSLADLEMATGLNKSSIYNTFKSKEGLYARCIERFRTEYTRGALAKLDHPDFKTALSRFFDVLLAGFDDPSCPNGCIATMGALEMGDKNNIVSGLISNGLEEMLVYIEQRCLKAIEDKQLDAKMDCSELAAMILAVTRGVVVLNMGTGNANTGRKAYDCVLSFISL